MSVASSQSLPGVRSIDEFFVSDKLSIARVPQTAQALLTGARWMLAAKGMLVQDFLRQFCASNNLPVDIPQLLEMSSDLLATSTCRKQLATALGGANKRLPGWIDLLASLLSAPDNVIDSSDVLALLGMTIILDDPTTAANQTAASESFFSYLWALFTLVAVLSESELEVGLKLWGFKFELRADFSVVLDPWQDTSHFIPFTILSGTPIPRVELDRGHAICATDDEAAFTAADAGIRLHRSSDSWYASGRKTPLPRPVPSDHATPLVFDEASHLELRALRAENAALRQAALPQPPLPKRPTWPPEAAKMRCPRPSSGPTAAAQALPRHAPGATAQGKQYSPAFTTGHPDESASSGADDEQSISEVEDVSLPSLPPPACAPQLFAHDNSVLASVLAMFNPTGTYTSLALARHLMQNAGFPVCLLHGTILAFTCGGRKSFHPMTTSVLHYHSHLRPDVPIEVSFPMCKPQLVKWFSELQKLISSNEVASTTFVFPFIELVSFILEQSLPAHNKVVAWARLLIFVFTHLNYAVCTNSPDYFDKQALRVKYEHEVHAENRVVCTVTDFTNSLIIGGHRCLHCQIPGGFSYTSTAGILIHMCPVHCKAALQANVASPPKKEYANGSAAEDAEAVKYYKEVRASLPSTHKGPVTPEEHDKFRKNSQGKWTKRYADPSRLRAGGGVSTAAPEAFMQCTSRLALNQSCVVVSDSM